jgi:hypothetical protein
MPEFDTEKLVEEAAKITGEEETPSESAAEETSTEEKTEETQSQEETSEDTTSIKSEEETKETEKTEETEKENLEEVPQRYDKDPAWQRIKTQRDTFQTERDEALKRASVADDLEEKLGDISVEELAKYKNVGSLLRKYPELAQEIQKKVDEHNYGNEEQKTEISSIKKEQQDLRNEIALDKYDKQVDKMISENKVDKDIEPLVKEVLANRVVSQKIFTKDLPRTFEKVLKDVNLAYRKKLASHIETKKTEIKVPASPTQKGKVIVTKSEATDAGSVAQEIAEGLKAFRGETVKE